MRLIDAEKLKKDVLDLPNCYNGFSDTFDKACIIGVIDEQPPAQPEIIRCKDCTEWDSSCKWCNRHGGTMDEDVIAWMPMPEPMDGGNNNG